MSRWFIAVAGTLLIALTGAARAQGSQPARITDEQLVGIHESFRAEVRVLADSALARGLPVEPILNMAQRATLKGATARVAVPAIGDLLKRMGTARGALGVAATGEDIKAGADAIQLGARSETLTKLAAARREATLFVSIGVIVDLVSANVPVDQAERIVTRLAAGGIRDGELIGIRDAVAGNIKLGAIPSAAAAAGVEATVVTDGSGNITGFRTATGIRVPGRDPIRP